MNNRTHHKSEVQKHFWDFKDLICSSVQEAAFSFSILSPVWVIFLNIPLLWYHDIFTAHLRNKDTEASRIDKTHFYDNLQFWCGIKITLRKTWFQCIFFFHTLSLCSSRFARNTLRVRELVAEQDLTTKYRQTGVTSQWQHNVWSHPSAKKKGAHLERAQDTEQQHWNAQVLICFPAPWFLTQSCLWDLLHKTVQA